MSFTGAMYLVIRIYTYIDPFLQIQWTLINIIQQNVYTEIINIYFWYYNGIVMNKKCKIDFLITWIRQILIKKHIRSRKFLFTKNMFVWLIERNSL
jgi:hypothetical protein